MVADISPSTDEERVHPDPDISSRTEDNVHRAPDMSPSTDGERIHPDPDVSLRTEDNVHRAPDIAPSTDEERLRLDPAKVKEHFDRIGHFRILVIGRSNAGKTTLLQRVCNTTELPDIFNAKGEKVKYPILHTFLQVTDVWQFADGSCDRAGVPGGELGAWLVI